MKKEFPQDYDFFPLTFLLPYELHEFKKQFLTQEEIEEAERLKKQRFVKIPNDKKKNEQQ